MQPVMWRCLLAGMVWTSVAFAASRGWAQDAAEDLNAPGPQHKLLDALVGVWDVSVKFPVGPGEYREGKASCEARWVMDGRFVRLEYNSSFAGKPLTVVRYVGYDRHRQKFVEMHFESSHTDVMHSEGEAAADQKSFTCNGRHVDVFSDRDVPVRTVTRFEPDHSFTLAMTYSPDDEKASRTVTLDHRPK